MTRFAPALLVVSALALTAALRVREALCLGRRHHGPKREREGGGEKPVH